MAEKQQGSSPGLTLEELREEIAQEEDLREMLETEHQPTQDEMARERTELSEHRTAMATERTTLAYERTALANWQTLLAFTRTAIAVFAAGIGMFEFIENRTIMLLGIAVMAVSPIIMTVGLVQYFRVRSRINRLVEKDDLS